MKNFILSILKEVWWSRGSVPLSLPLGRPARGLHTVRSEGRQITLIHYINNIKKFNKKIKKKKNFLPLTIVDIRYKFEFTLESETVC